MQARNRCLIEPRGPLMAALGMSDRVGVEAARAWLSGEMNRPKAASRRARREQRRRDRNA